MAQHRLEQGTRFCVPARYVKRLDQPEGADVEGGFRRAEIVFGRIAKHVVAAPQFPLDRGEGGRKARVVGRDEAQLDHLQQAGVEIIALEARAVMAAMLAILPRFGFDALADRVGPLPPEVAPVRLAEMIGHIGQPVAGRPAHDGGIGVDFLPRAEFPQARIRLIVHGPGRFADLFQFFEIVIVRHAQQAPVEETLRGRHHDLSITIVLDLRVGRIAPPHGPHPAIACQIGCEGLFQLVFAHHGIERLDLPALGRIDDIAQIAKVFFQHVERAEPVQGLHRVIGIADPAEPVIPVPLAARCLGDRGRQRSDDGAGFLVLAQFQADGAADHLVLPFQRDMQAARPDLPVIARQRFHPPQFGPQIADEGLIRAEEEMQIAFDPEVPVFQHISDRRVAAEPQRLRADEIAYVIGPIRGRRDLRPVIAHRVQHDAQPRIAGDRADIADPGIGPVHPARAFEARAEIADFDRAAIRCRDPGDEDRGVALVTLLDRSLPFELEAPDPRIAPISVEKRTEDRIPIHPRNTAPDERTRPVHQAADLAIADGP